MNPYDTCLYTIRRKSELDEAARNGTGFDFHIEMRWVGAKAQFEKARQAGKDYVAVFSDAAAQTDKIYHLGIVTSIEVDKTTRIELSKITSVENEIMKTDLVKLSGGNISKAFIRPYALCKTPDFSSFPTLRAEAASDSITNYDLVTVPDAKEYVDGLRAIQPKMRAEHYRIFQAHYQMPGRTATVRELAEAAAISAGYPMVNLLHGRLGHMFCEATGFVPALRPDDSARWWAVWSVGRRSKNHGFLWQMRPQVVEALETLGWVKAPISEETFRKKEQEETAKSLVNTEGERQARLAVAQSHPGTLQVVRTEFQRNPDVVASVLLRARGRCELCGTNAPFLRFSDDSPYLEIHHVVFLSEGGEDTLRNAVALCPNCHREVHYGTEKDRYIEALQRSAEKARSR